MKLRQRCCMVRAAELATVASLPKSKRQATGKHPRRRRECSFSFTPAQRPGSSCSSATRPAPRPAYTPALEGDDQPNYLHYITIGRTYSLVHLLIYLLTYLHSWLGEYKTSNISETVQAKVTINGLYKVVHGLSIAAKR